MAFKKKNKKKSFLEFVSAKHHLLLNMGRGRGASRPPLRMLTVLVMTVSTAVSSLLLTTGLLCRFDDPAVPGKEKSGLLAKSLSAVCHPAHVAPLSAPLIIIGTVTLVPIAIVAIHLFVRGRGSLRAAEPQERASAGELSGLVSSDSKQEIRDYYGAAVPAKDRRARSAAQNSGLMYLYAGHFLSCFGDRLWQFAVPVLLMDVMVDTLLPGALFSLSIYLGCILAMPYVGKWIDTTSRRRVKLLSLVIENVCIVVTSAGLAYLIVFTGEGHLDPRVRPTWTPRLYAYFGGLVAVSVIGEIFNNAQTIALEKDWLVEIAKATTRSEDGFSSRLQHLNTTIRRLDLLCKILAPTAFGLVLQFGVGKDNITHEATTGALLVGVWNLLSFPVEFAFNKEVLAAYPILEAKTHTHEDGTIHAHPGWHSPHEHPKVTSPRVTSMPRSSASDTTGFVVLQSSKGGGKGGGAWSTYFSHRVFLASVAYCLLYLTVLDNGALMTSYLRWRDFPAGYLGASRGLCAVFGIAGTFAFPAIHRCTGSLTRAGLISIWMFWILQLPSVLSFWWWGESSTSDYATMLAMIISRVGLWSFDLAETQLLQEWVEEEDRGTINSMQIATYRACFVVIQGLGMIFHNPADFPYLVAVSTGTVLLASVIYSAWYARHNVGAYQIVDELGNIKLTVTG